MDCIFTPNNDVLTTMTLVRVPSFRVRLNLTEKNSTMVFNFFPNLFNKPKIRGKINFTYDLGGAWEEHQPESARCQQKSGHAGFEARQPVDG